MLSPYLNTMIPRENEPYPAWAVEGVLGKFTIDGAHSGEVVLADFLFVIDAGARYIQKLCLPCERYICDEVKERDTRLMIQKVQSFF